MGHKKHKIRDLHKLHTHRTKIERDSLRSIEKANTIRSAGIWIFSPSDHRKVETNCLAPNGRSKFVNGVTVFSRKQTNENPTARRTNRPSSFYLPNGVRGLMFSNRSKVWTLFVVVFLQEEECRAKLLFIDFSMAMLIVLSFIYSIL